MNYHIMDLEWNNAFSCRHGKFVNEIIEIGAVRLNDALEHQDEFSQLIKPRLSGRLSSIVKNLTSITMDELGEGVPFAEAVNRLGKWMGEEEHVVLTWSDTDLHVLLENFKKFLNKRHIPFLQKYADLQKYLQHRLEIPGGNQIALANAAGQLEIDLTGRDMHRALDDSRVCAEMLKTVFEKESFAGFTADARRPDFYRRLTFKNRYITDVKNPGINKNDLRFTCERCGKYAKRMSRWAVRNKSLSAVFCCGSCGHMFRGNVRIKKTFDETVVTRSVFPYELPKEGSSDDK
ncbi:MAG TPA: hypothetical protein DEQ02_02285 [Ruminococcaceae bacterium]|nr:hypothetical protein [Oscillospiraceae bacterium]